MIEWKPQKLCSKRERDLAGDPAQSFATIAGKIPTHFPAYLPIREIFKQRM